MYPSTLLAIGLASLTLILTGALTNGATYTLSPRHTVPRWERALIARSRALDRHYHLGSYQRVGAGIVPPGRDPAWLRALDVRSIGLDQRYRLGSFSPPIVL